MCGCMGEDDLRFFLHEDLKLLSCLSYLGHCWKDTEIITEGRERKERAVSSTTQHLVKKM